MSNSGQNTWWRLGPDGVTVHRPGDHVEIPWEDVGALCFREGWRTHHGAGTDTNTYRVHWIDVVVDSGGAVPIPEEPTRGRLRRIIEQAKQLEVLPGEIRVEEHMDQ